MHPRRAFTLIELLITVGLFTIIVTIAIGGFTNAIKTERQVSSLISAQSNVSLAIEQISRDIRTGYLFCHDPNVATPSSSCDDADATDPAGTTCTVDDSSGSPIWTCPALDFYDAESNHINYSWAGGQLVESVNGNPALSITGDTISVKYLQFRLFGQTEGDPWSPRVTISIGIAPSSSDPAIANNVINFQTTVSSRDFDGPAAGSSGNGNSGNSGSGGNGSDTTPPSVPANLAVTGVTASTVSLSWDPSSDNIGVAGYDIYRNGSPSPVGTAAGTSFMDSNLVPNTTYSYTVSAFDAAQNNSAQSSATSTTTSASSGNNNPPSTPQNLAANVISANEIDLLWNASQDSAGGGGITGYTIYRNGSQLTTTQNTSYQDMNIPNNPNAVYTYTVSATDFNGNTSAQSAPASATPQVQSGGPTGNAPIDSSYHLVFDSEFNGNSLDTSKWSTGWFGSGITQAINSNETDCYDPTHVSVSNGSLNLVSTQQQENCGGVTQPYTSAAITTDSSGNANGYLETFTYGYYEARINVPADPSTGQVANWPAWWAFAESGPADPDEVDVLEGLHGSVCGTFHSPPGSGATSNCDGSLTGWHTFGALWAPNTVTWYYDGNVIGSTDTSGITPDPMELVLVNSIGGVGGPTDATDMQVDWVHVYSNNPNVPTVAPESGYTGPGGGQ